MFRRVIKEVRTKDHITVRQFSLLVFTGIVFVNYLITKCNTLGPEYSGIASIIVLFTALTVFTFLAYRYLATYTYILDEDDLIFEKGIGDKKKTVLTVNIDEVEWIKPYNTVSKNEKIKKTYKFIYNKDDDLYVGQFKKYGKKYRFIFEPSPRMVKALRTIQNASY